MLSVPCLIHRLDCFKVNHSGLFSGVIIGYVFLVRFEFIFHTLAFPFFPIKKGLHLAILFFMCSYPILYLMYPYISPDEDTKMTSNSRHLVFRNSAAESRSALLDQETDELVNAQKYERSKAIGVFPDG